MIRFPGPEGPQCQLALLTCFPLIAKRSSRRQLSRALRKTDLRLPSSRVTGDSVRVKEAPSARRLRRGRSKKRDALSARCPERT